MFKECVTEAAYQLYPRSTNSRNRMIADFEVLYKSIHTVLPLLGMVCTGLWSLSIISLAAESAMAYYFYSQLIGLYTAIRSHGDFRFEQHRSSNLITRIGSDISDPRENISPERELKEVVKRFCKSLPWG